MNSFQSTTRRKIRNGWWIRSVSIYVPVLLILATGGFGGAAIAEAREADGSFWDAVTQGKPALDMRSRIEIANADGLSQSEAYTLRTRLGYGTKPWHGGMLYIEAENTTAVATRQYFKTVEIPTGQTPIADPTNTEVNQAYLKIARKDLLDSSIIAGRQRIILDDARFVGNVGWRQNEQTFDAALGSSSLGVEDLKVTYGYIRYARRIFGDQGALPTRDLKSNGHVVNASYAGLGFAKFTSFAYILDLRESPANSSATFGLRITGAPTIADKMKLIYEASYAYQKDHADNPVDYGAHYAMGQVKLAQSDLGSIGVGYELLGSDEGDARFVTPLATAHKFNGWADVFLDNGGVDGLRDLFVSVAPKLPYEFSGSVVYHRFWSDHDGTSLGDEVDVLVKRPINKHLSVLLKSAYFDSSHLARPDIWRVSMQADLKF